MCYKGKSMNKYYFCFGGADFAGASAEDLEPEIVYGSEDIANKTAEDMCIQAHDTYGVEDDEDIETEYNDCFIKVLNNEDLHNWGLIDKLKRLVIENQDNWELVKETYGLTEEW